MRSYFEISQVTTLRFSAVIKLFIVAAILIFTSQIGSLTSDLETQHHPTTDDASSAAQLPEMIGQRLSYETNVSIIFSALFPGRISFGCCSPEHDIQT